MLMLKICVSVIQAYWNTWVDKAASHRQRHGWKLATSFHSTAYLSGSSLHSVGNCNFYRQVQCSIITHAITGTVRCSHLPVLTDADHMRRRLLRQTANIPTSFFTGWTQSDIVALLSVSLLPLQTRHTHHVLVCFRLDTADSINIRLLHYIIVINDFKEKTSITLQELNAIKKMSFQSTSENR